MNSFVTIISIAYGNYKFSRISLNISEEKLKEK